MLQQEPVNSLQRCLFQHVFGFDPNPSPQELEIAIKRIEEQFPSLNPEKIIDRLFLKMKMLQYSHSIPSKVDFGEKPSLVVKNVARSLYFFGFGYSHFRADQQTQILEVSLFEEDYYQTCRNLAVQLYRYLEKYLTRNGFLIKLKHIHYVIKIIPLILKSEQLIGQVGHLLLKRLMARCFDLDDESLRKEEAFKLYSILQQKRDSSTQISIEESSSQFPTQFFIQSDQEGENEHCNIGSESFNLQEEGPSNENYFHSEDLHIINEPQEGKDLENCDNISLQGIQIDELLNYK